MLGDCCSLCALPCGSFRTSYFMRVRVHLVHATTFISIPLRERTFLRPRYLFCCFVPTHLFSANRGGSLDENLSAVLAVDETSVVPVPCRPNMIHECAGTKRCGDAHGNSWLGSELNPPVRGMRA